MCADELGSLSSGGGGTDDTKKNTEPAALPLTELSRITVIILTSPSLFFGIL
jgi:hypothetical protein